MVSTRRSGQRQETTDISQGSGPSTSPQRVRATAGRGRGRSAARGAPAGPTATQLKPIEEDTAHHGATVQDVADLHVEPAACDREGHAHAVSADFQHVKATTAPASSASDLSEGIDDGELDSDTDDILGPNLMDNLASSLRAALQARAGTRGASPSPPPQTQRTEVTRQRLGLSSDPDDIRWKPEVEQPKTVKAQPQRVMQGSGATKEKGLAKQLMAPPRGSSHEPGAAADSKRWFALPATKITDEVKQELRLLRLRGAYDPKRFYKSFDETKFPKHFQIGTVLDNPEDFYSSRLAARERGATITQELLADPAVAASRKKRYAKLQKEATRFQKVKKRKSDLVRTNPKPKRPKH